MPFVLQSFCSLSNYDTIMFQVVKIKYVHTHPPANAGDIRDTDPIPRLGRSPGGGHGNPLQFPCLEETRGSHGQWSLESYSPQDSKESDTTEVTQHAHTHSTKTRRHPRAQESRGPTRMPPSPDLYTFLFSSRNPCFSSLRTHTLHIQNSTSCYWRIYLVCMCLEMEENESQGLRRRWAFKSTSQLLQKAEADKLTSYLWSMPPFTRPASLLPSQT